jgi:hypothetical protein
MRHETGLLSAVVKKASCVRFWTGFFAYALRIARFERPKYEAISNSGTRRDDETDERL